MMGILGQYTDKFEDANLACCAGISLDGGYRHYFFDVLSIVDGYVTLKSHYDGTQFVFKICCGRRSEFCWIELISNFDAIFGRDPEKFKVLPMVGKRI